MNDAPLVSGHYTVNQGRPPYADLGREVPYKGLPKNCKTLILDTYKKMWNL
jgi:hypothetical protein